MYKYSFTFDSLSSLMKFNENLILIVIISFINYNITFHIQFLCFWNKLYPKIFISSKI